MPEWEIKSDKGQTHRDTSQGDQSSPEGASSSDHQHPPDDPRPSATLPPLRSDPRLAFWGIILIALGIWIGFNRQGTTTHQPNRPSGGGFKSAGHHLFGALLIALLPCGMPTSEGDRSLMTVMDEIEEMGSTPDQKSLTPEQIEAISARNEILVSAQHPIPADPQRVPR